MSRRLLGQALTILAAGLAVAATRQPLAQGGRGASDADDARTDALLGTPNRMTPVPQSNRFSTAPRLEQQAPRPGGGSEVQPGGTPAGGDKR